MTRLLSIHPSHPQARLIAQCVDCLKDSGVIVYPTDSAYALGCCISSQRAIDELRRLRGLRKNHLLTLLCADLSVVSLFARVDNEAFKWLKSCVPGPYTFVLRATGATPRRVRHERRRTVGIRVPDNVVTAALLAALDEPLISTTLKPAGADRALTDPREAARVLKGRIGLVLDAGEGSAEATTVVDLTEGLPSVLRPGLGDTAVFEYMS
ncbi:MAG: threonylcarbamoyl-AMP synthase [Gammaproteobacteria bacterium]|nr:threonylcarbamoyl-AMP synthase [Gammaproteobacteria bacterium]